MVSYHIKDAYFERAARYLGTPNNGLMSNKENNGYRPHFVCLPDKSHPDILWAIPQSSRCEKYEKIVEHKIKKYGKCDTIVIGKFAGRKNAFLIQNMFPILRSDIDHVHTQNGAAVSLHPKLANEIIEKAHDVVNAHKRGHITVFTDIAALYQMVLDNLNNKVH